MWAGLNFMVPCCLFYLNFFYAVIYLQIEVGPISIGLDVGGVAGLEYQWGDVVELEKMCGPIIKMAVIAIK